MTEQQIQDAIAALYEATSDTPVTSDDDYLTRRQLINRALHSWEFNKGFWWDELWTTDTSKTVLTSTQTYAAPTNFRRAAGVVELWDASGNRIKTYPVYKPNDSRISSQVGSPYAYFTGNPLVGFTLNLYPAVTAVEVGTTIKYDYYKKATEYTSSSTISEIPDPEYIIHAAVAELWKTDNKMGAYQTSLGEAQEKLKAMEVSHVANIDWNSMDGDMTSGFGV